METMSRRRFLARGAMTMGAGMLAFNGVGSAWAHDGTLSGFNAITEAIKAAQNTPDAAEVRDLMANVVKDPALPAVTTALLQAYGTSLTSFQKDILEALLAMTYNQDALAAMVAGTALTKAQERIMRRVMGTVQNNRAIQRLKRAGAQLKGHPATLAADVSAIINETNLTIPNSYIPGNANLSAVMTDIANLRNSPAFARFTDTLVSVMENPRFVGFLRTRNPLMTASFMAPSAVMALELPQGVDPPLSPATTDILHILGGVIGYVALFFEGPVAWGIALVALVVGLTPDAVDLYYQENPPGDSDGDNDGD